MVVEGAAYAQNQMQLVQLFNLSVLKRTHDEQWEVSTYGRLGDIIKNVRF